MRAGVTWTMRIAIAVALVVALISLPAAALGDPGHSVGQPHLGQEQPSDGGGGSSTLAIVITLVSLVLFAVCAFVLKRAQQKRSGSVPPDRGNLTPQGVRGNDS
jgi:hypothetical protein